MNKSIKSLIALSLAMNLITLVPQKPALAASDNDTDSNECFQEDGVFGDILDVDNIRDIFSSFSDEDELNWYYVGKGKDQIAEGPKESVSFLKENSAYYLGDTSKKVLYLTFDEGYENGNTGKILDILKECQVPAAFFVVKPYIDTQPELIKRMVDEGHVVGNHTVHHPSIAQIRDKEKFEAEFTGVENAFKELTGQDMPKFFRPPMGKYSKKSLAMTKDLGYKTIFWSFAYKDWLVNNQPSESYAVEKICKGAHPGSIMLLHAVSNTNTKVLSSVIKTLQKEGYEFKSLNDLPTE
ncbi:MULTISPECIES: delta-lactam-biosynthetic de-N-acetylase [Clostridium]|jgi:delta-lactam-biosynthetic de-N-acetylase|uniref:Delta-lactam-biosynthetic de-N-acetylase n=4 Tax=Clostridium TaxID=1485 RepID=A0AAV3VX66_9CLOT|nr:MULTISPECIES: delta-lactam-biosynthetic de-N-acetylase [Clostridium]ABR33177.1 Delta-lactam-biosynthetic de-N-acetylase [Clostridium beijerinckii NCIMB 8052]AIU04216.1 Delta-lactam-biosynthetic de-N-acetylase [Clostridium beijerinckii ATCC 35702]MBF7807143.1 delta-lactam-biosynthetic de-N-acetylase [Clostridium beijerinckii]NOW93010.1 peptidoglycan-N-acetylmuramic acid deacetylase [Clostridium beijerinckii]NRT25576.1 peptidoglycan-N-acetylmuramic acid deacetylase [Clostridium beijerinckii]